MRFIKGTFLLEFFVAIPGMVIAAALVSAPGWRALPSGDSPQVRVSAGDVRVAPKPTDSGRVNAPVVIAGAVALHADGKHQPRAGQSVLPVRARQASNAPPNSVHKPFPALPAGTMAGSLVPGAAKIATPPAPQHRTHASLGL